MYNVRCKRDFYYKDFDKCFNIIRNNKKKENTFFANDRFSCTKEMYIYLDKGNDKKLSLVELIGIDKK